MDKRYLKKTPEELQEYISFKRRHSIVPNKKARPPSKETLNIKRKTLMKSNSKI